LIAFSLVLAGPMVADWLGRITSFGATFTWTWLILQWPLAFALVSTAVGLVYYFAPDAEQDWVWITPGAVMATVLWLVISLLFKLYIANFTDYNASYGAVGGVIVLLLWFYVSSLAILAGAELNAEIEHASPYGKAPGQKSAQGKRLLGARAERAFHKLGLAAQSPVDPRSTASEPTARPALGAAVLGGLLLSRFWTRRPVHSSRSGQSSTSG
jgi:membrane protein